MKPMDYLFVAITALLCGASLYLMLRDVKRNGLKAPAKPEKKSVPSAPEEAVQTAAAEAPAKAAIPLSMKLYSTVMIVLTLGISVELCLLYSDNSFLFSLKRAALLCVLWPVGYIDFKTYRIPNSFVLFGLACRIAILIPELIFASEGLGRTLMSEGIAAGALVLAALLCTLCMKNSVGFGDIKLFAVMGLLLGLYGIGYAMVITMLVSFVMAIVLLATKKKTRKDTIPFGPAIVIGTFLSVFLTGM